MSESPREDSTWSRDQMEPAHTSAAPQSSRSDQAVKSQRIEPQPVRRPYGDLQCVVVDGGTHPDIPVILCHGYGAPGHDLAGLAWEWLGQLEEEAARFRFVFPAAPLSLADQGMPDGRAWWPLNMARLLDMAGASRFDELHDEEPPELDRAREKLLSTIAAVFADLPSIQKSEGVQSDGSGSANQSPVTWALGGFSQGAMLSMDVVLRSAIPPPAMLMQFSGTMICQPVWKASLKRLTQTQVLQSHGTQDPILPFDSAVRLQSLLQDGGVSVHFHRFVGPHTIDPETISLAAQMFRQTLLT